MTTESERMAKESERVATELEHARRRPMPWFARAPDA